MSRAESVRVVAVTDSPRPDLDLERDVLLPHGVEVVRLQEVRSPRDVIGLLTLDHRVDGGLMDRFPNLRVVSTYGAGYDNIDTAAARERHVQVRNVPDGSTTEVAEHVIALTLALRRKIVAANELVLSGGWDVTELAPIHRMSDTVFGIVGMGAIGRSVATLARGLGWKVQWFDPHVRADAAGFGTKEGSVIGLAQSCDVLSIHVPLNKNTENLIDVEVIRSMKRGAVLVNTSRGPVLQVPPLLSALRAGHLAGAALDVFPVEPPDVTQYRGVPNLVLTPHMAFYSKESSSYVRRAAARTILDERGRDLAVTPHEL